MRAIFLMFLGLSACSKVGSAPQFDSVLLAPLNLQLDFSPAPAPDGVARNAEIRILFDDFPDPDTAVFGPLVLRSGTVNVDFDVRVDLNGKAIALRPRTELQSGTRYEVAVSPEVRALDNRAVGGEGQVLSFDVGTTIAPPPTPAPTLTWDHDVQPIIGTCAIGCHDRKEFPTGVKMEPFRQLDLTGDIHEPLFGLVNVPSVGSAGIPGLPPFRVVPGDSARSVLLRKLLGGDRRLDSRDEEYPEMKVDGRRMPLFLIDPDAPNRRTFEGAPQLPNTAIQTVQDWIDQGAN
jgi:hypothetical protein